MEPAKLTMRAPDGRDVMVLERDRAQFEAQGYTYVGPFPDSRTKPAQSVVPADKAAERAVAEDEEATARLVAALRDLVDVGEQSEPEPPSAPEDSAAEGVTPSPLAVESRAFEKPSRGTRTRKG